MDIYAVTKKGFDKKVSEDNVFVKNIVLNNNTAEFKNIEIPFIAAVSDGVGGNVGGNDASSFIINNFKNYDFENYLSEKSIKLFIQNINSNLLDYSKTVKGKEKMASTLSGILYSEKKLYIFHIGNTRVYCTKGNYLKQLTQDHTTYQWLKNIGDNEGAELCNKNEITNCMGGGNEQFLKSLTVFEVDWPEKNGNLIITSDGIHDYISIDDFEEIVCKNELSLNECESIIELTEKNGSKDDISIIIIKKD